MIYSLNSESGLFRDTLISRGCSDKKLLSNFCLTPLGEHSLTVFESNNSEGSSYWWCCMVQVYDQNLNKLFTIDLKNYTFLDLRVASRKNNEALIMNFKDSNISGIISWNTDTECFKSYVGSIGPKGLEDLPNYGCILRGVRPFIETLVLLNDRDAEKNSCPNYQFNFKTISTTLVEIIRRSMG